MLIPMSGLAFRRKPGVPRNCHLVAMIASLCLPVMALNVQAKDVQDTATSVNKRVSQSVVGLAQAYELALSNDAGLKAARAQVNGTAERIEQAKASLLPNVSASASRFWNDLSRTQNNILGVPTSVDERYFSHSQTLQVRQPIYRPVLNLNLDQARAQLADAEALYNREAQSLGMKVVESYLHALQP